MNKKHELTKYILKIIIDNPEKIIKLPSERFLSYRFEATRSLVREIYIGLLRKQIITKNSKGYFSSSNGGDFYWSLLTQMKGTQRKTLELIKDDIKILDKYNFQINENTIIKNIFIEEKKIKAINYILISDIAKKHIKVGLSKKDSLYQKLAKKNIIPGRICKKRIDIINGGAFLGGDASDIFEVFESKSFSFDNELIEHSLQFINSLYCHFNREINII